MLGTHLCGSLSPRLVDLFARTEGLGGLVLCPCCLRGGLGYRVKREARARKGDSYDLLVRTLVALCEAELADAAQAAGGGAPRVGLVVDAQVISPKNAFIVAAKARGVAPK